VEPSGVPFNPPRRDACSSAGCHGPILEKLARLHGPVAIGECSACHLPHASAYAGLLRRRPETLCRGCHQALYTCPARREGEGAECASCHDAHGGADARFLHDHLAARDGSR
jgi:predicted CXXCH cytochrome family protein